MCQACGGDKAKDVSSAISSIHGVPFGKQPVIYKIESLTIHNYGSVSMLTDNLPPTNSAAAHTQNSAFVSDQITTTTTRRHAQIGFRNNFPVKLSKVRIVHQYSDESLQVQIWDDVDAGATTNPDLGADYATGLFSGDDLWWLDIVFEDGITLSTDQKQCNLEEKDEAGRGALYFDIADGSFQTRTRSSPCSTGFSTSRQRYNSVAFLKVKNNFPVALTGLELKHKYSDFDNFTAPFAKLTLRPGGETHYWAVYYNSGLGRTGNDYWNTWFQLQVPGPRNATDKFGTGKFTNSQLDVGWTFTAGNWGKSFTFEFDGRGMRWENSPITTWITPLKYNTAAFVNIQNACHQDIKELVLQHQYSDDAKYEYQYNDISMNSLSSQVFMMEYFTGGLHSGYDYWNITIELKDGKKYRNTKADKQCYLESDDAKLLTYKVSEDKFHLGQTHGCDDEMKPFASGSAGSEVFPHRSRNVRRSGAGQAQQDELEDDMTVVDWSDEGPQR